MHMSTVNIIYLHHFSVLHYKFVTEKGVYANNTSLSKEEFPTAICFVYLFISLVDA